MVRDITIGATLVALVLGAAPGCDGVNPIGGGSGPWGPDDKPFILETGGKYALDRTDPSNIGIQTLSFSSPFDTDFFYTGAEIDRNLIKFPPATIEGEGNQIFYDRAIVGTHEVIENFEITDTSGASFLFGSYGLSSPDPGCPDDAEIFNNLIGHFGVLAYFQHDDVEDFGRSENYPYLALPTDVEPENGSDSILEIVNAPITDYICAEFPCSQDVCDNPDDYIGAFDF